MSGTIIQPLPKMNTHSNEIETVYRILKKEFYKNRTPVVELIEAQTNDPFKILVTTILSARTRDQTTLAAVEKLFKEVNKPADLNNISCEQLQDIIYPVGFYREKAAHLKKLPHVLDTLFDGRLPDTVEQLVKLPGVGRKTANLVVAVAFKKPAVCVDIHVHRIFNRLGYLRTKTPFDTEMELRKYLPEKYWTTFNSYFVSFGQNRCFPLRPECGKCPVYKWCARVGVKESH